MNLIKVNWVYNIMEHMLKSNRLANYRFPYAILVSKLIDHFGVDTTNERNETIKAVSEIDNSTLIKMGFHKMENNCVFHKSRTHREEHGGSNLNNEKGDDAVYIEEDTAEQSCYEVPHSSHRMESPSMSQRMRSPSIEHKVDSPAPPSMNEDFAATNYNALVVYQAPEYRVEPMSMFERQVLHRLDVLLDDQKTYFEATQDKFQHLDHQIKGIQEQLAEMYYK